MAVTLPTAALSGGGLGWLKRETEEYESLAMAMTWDTCPEWALARC